MSCRCAALLLMTAMLVGAQTVNPTSYSMPNGEIGPGGLLFRDDIYTGTGDNKQDGTALSGGLGQLSDGTTACADDPAKDCGRGPGYEWVGWHTDPTITFAFGERCDFRTLRVFAANWPEGGVHLWKTATISVSDDGLDFRDFVVFTSTSEDQQNHKARYIDIPLRGSGQFVRIRLIRADPNSWVAISEVQFEGRVSRDQAPPARPK